jgi:hypothetical protein
VKKRRQEEYKASVIEPLEITEPGDSTGKDLLVISIIHRSISQRAVLKLPDPSF